MKPKSHRFSPAAISLNAALVLAYLCATISSVAGQNSIYSGDSSGSEKITHDIIFNEDSESGEYQIYAIGQNGLKSITPDAIVDDDEYQGSCRVYHVCYPEMNELISARKAGADSSDKTIPIYSLIQLGLGDIRPSGIIERDDNGQEIRIYRVDSLGHRESNPAGLVKKDGNRYRVYAVDENGEFTVIPVRKVQTAGEPQASGVLLLPSIERVTHDAANTTIQTVRRVREMPDSMIDKQEWRSSRGTTEMEKE